MDDIAQIDECPGSSSGPRRSGRLLPGPPPDEGIKKTGTENFGGPIVTAGGVVFCSGTRDSRIRAFDKETGQELWSAKLPRAGSAPPASYQIDGRQFIVVPSTGGGKLGAVPGDAYVAFSLPAARSGSSAK